MVSLCFPYAEVYRTAFSRAIDLGTAGAMTDPPALAFANGVAGNEDPAMAYATVYPLTMILRVVPAQVLMVLLCS